MAEVTTIDKQTRVRCSDEQFLEAVFSSKTYAEIASKTGQKVASTAAIMSRLWQRLFVASRLMPTVD